MREAAFIKKNEPRWKEFETALSTPVRPHPDKLAEIFIQLTDDLSFAQTQYPQSRTSNYLNSLASRIHLEIYKNKKEDKNRFLTFWKYEVPHVVHESRKQLFYALIIFLIATLLGVVSANYDDTFVRLIMGDGYVNMTLENIEKGNPMAVYGGSGETDMFFMITINNIRVSFLAFTAGIVLSIGAGWILFQNGVLVGAFIGFLIKQGVFMQSISVIMLHGTIELSSIAIAGGAGFVIGNSILFPGTYSRLESFKRGAKRGVKIIVGLIPLFVIAGFIESFVTRYTFMPDLIKMTIIGGSALLILFYFVIYPRKLYSNARKGKN
jgi:uncharacterized membrane protein SpoIIM required for sporulation